MSKVVTLPNIPDREDVMSPPPAPHILFTAKADEKISLLVEHSDLEIGWECVVSKEGEFNYVVWDVRAPNPQTVTAATFKYSEASHGKCIDQLMADGAFTPEKGGEKRGAWGLGHSHVNMGVTPSQADVDQMMEYYTHNQPFCVQTIHNKKGDVNVAVYDFENKVYWSSAYCTWSVESALTQAEIDDVMEQVDGAERYVHKAPAKVYHNGRYNYKPPSTQASSGPSFPDNAAIDYDDTEATQDWINKNWPAY